MLRRKNIFSKKNTYYILSVSFLSTTLKALIPNYLHLLCLFNYHLLMNKNAPIFNCIVFIVISGNRCDLVSTLRLVVDGGIKGKFPIRSDT